MRINKYIALAAGVSRRQADLFVDSGRVRINGEPVRLGHAVQPGDEVTLDDTQMALSEKRYILMNKPVGVVTSRKSQRGDATIYDLLPEDMHELKPAGRLDKDSSGLLLLTNDGDYIQQMTHPRHHKQKTYTVVLNKPLAEEDKAQIESGVALDDGASALQLNGKDTQWTVAMHEGRNRQIRRTFKSVGYVVTELHRTHFGPYDIASLDGSVYKIVKML